MCPPPTPACPPRPPPTPTRLPTPLRPPPNVIDQYLGSATVKKAVNTAVREITRSIFGARKRG
jgi:uncharacterized protein